MRSHFALAAAALADDPMRQDQGLPGRSDVICGIRATAGGVHPQAIREPSTTLRGR